MFGLRKKVVSLQTKFLERKMKKMNPQLVSFDFSAITLILVALLAALIPLALTMIGIHFLARIFPILKILDISEYF